MERTHPVATLEGTRLGSYVLHVNKLQQMKMSGWRFFTIGLSAPPPTHGPWRLISESPIIEGIYSRGGKGVTPWLEILSYCEKIALPDRHGGHLVVALSATGLDKRLFKLLGELIPPGGHIMAWYEDTQDEETYLAINKGLPPVVTKLGSLLFWAGCLEVRDFPLPEGGLEGCKKLWGEKPINEHHKRVLEKRTAELLHNFLARGHRPVKPQLEADVEVRAREVLSVLES